MKKKKKIGDDVHNGQLVTPFQSVGKSAAIVNTASDFVDANLNVKKKLVMTYTLDNWLHLFKVLVNLRLLITQLLILMTQT